MSDNTPKLGKITRHAGVAGQVSYSTTVDYGDGDGSEPIEFVGSVYGGPVVMITPSGMQTFVTEPERFGTFGPEWVRRFFTR